jgi:O-antigen/teichoic acid export membrane protein
MVHGTMLAPLWSAFTDAETRNDQTWIKSMLRKQIQYLGLVIILALLLALLSPYLINFVGSGMVGYSKIMVGCMACMVIITSWANIFAIYLNGIGVLNVQFYTSIISIFLNFPISIWLVKTTDLGPSAIIVGTCISLLPAALFLPLQVFRRLNVPPSKYSI